MAQDRRPRQPAEPQPQYSGGPGEEPQEPPPQELTGPQTPEPPAPPTGTSIRIGGREFTVEPELAAALEGRETDFSRRLSEQGRELGDLRTWRRQMEAQQPKPEKQEYNYDTRLFERPTETLAEIEERAVRRAKEDIRQEYRGEEAQRRNWERFYRNNPDLADEERLVKAVASDLLQDDHWRESRDLGAFTEELAKQTRAELLRISRKTREADTPGERMTRGRAPVEGGGGGRRTTEAAEPARPKTISDLLLEKQAKRRAVAE